MHTTEQLNTALAGRYAIDRLIGEGGMATVYLARDTRHNRNVALKVLRPDLGAVVGVDRFLSEIQVTANLQHPNLLALFDSGEAGGLLFYVMPYIEGESLRARLEREKQLPVEDALHIASAVAAALDYAHRHGVIHRDLKPENILLHDGHPLVADFGIALAVSNAGGNRITQTGLSLGTPQYMSPEQATGDRVIDARSDVYSLGAVTYEMLTGEAPHAGATSQAIIARVLTEKPRSIRATRPSVPPHVEAAIDHALEKLAPDRFATAKEFAEAITGVRTFTSSAVTAPVAPAAATPLAGAVRPRAQRLREAAILAVGAAGVAVGAWYATRPDPVPLPAEFIVDLPDSVQVSSASAHTVAVSRDGSRLAILGNRGAQRAIYVRRLDDPVAQPVRGSEGALFHSFSPDGESLVFLIGAEMKVVPTAGGTPRRIADSVFGTPPSWTESGEVLYVARNQVWAVSGDGGDRRRIAGPDSANGVFGFRAPVALPGDRHVLVQAMTGSGIGSARLAIVSLGNGEIRDLDQPGSSPAFAAPGHVLFAREDGAVFARPFSLRRGTFAGPPVQVLEQVSQTATVGLTGFAVSHSGVLAHQVGGAATQRMMYRVSRDGQARALTPEPRTYREPRVSPDGRRIVVRVGTGDWLGGLWVFDVGAGSLRRLTPDSQAIRGEWTRDGRRIVYTDRANTDEERIASRPWDLSESASITVRSPAPASYVGVSLGPPGGYIATRRGARSASDILIAPSDSLAAARPFIQGPAEEYDPTISPDGKLLAYTSNESGRPEVYVTTIPEAGPRIPVSIDGGSEPRWAHEGTTLFYRSPTHLMAAAVVQRAQLEVTRRESLFADTYNRYLPYAAYDVFPGGRDFVMTTGPDVRSTVHVIMNWQQLDRVRGSRSR